MDVLTKIFIVSILVGFFVALFKKSVSRGG